VRDSNSRPSRCNSPSNEVLVASLKGLAADDAVGSDPGHITSYQIVENDAVDQMIGEIESHGKELTMSPKMKIVPAVFFQKQLDGVKEDVRKPERLELFESQLREVAGGRAAIGGLAGGSAGGRLTVGESDGSGGSTTFSGSAGWLDVMQADDCAA
jgi:hypothetical protein